MKKYILFLLSFIFLFACKPVIEREYEDPESLYGELYQAVISERIFENDKTFWDAIPKEKPEKIVSLYKTKSKKDDFNLKEFIYRSFNVPDYPNSFEKSELSYEDYVNQSLEALVTKPKNEGSLLTTRMYYTSGGNIFQEYNYFTSFFALKGFQALGEDSLAYKMGVNAFQFLQDYGYVPYGNRTYYLGFSDFPMLPFLAEAIAEINPNMLPWFSNLMGRYYQTQMGLATNDKKEYKKAIEAKEKAYKTVVFLDDNLTLNRYFNISETDNKYIDFLKTTRWKDSDRFGGKGRQNPESYVLVDLNATMVLVEKMLARSFEAKGQSEYADSYNNLAKIRTDLMNKYLFDEAKGYYYDYNFETGQRSQAETLAGVFPLLTGISSAEQSKRVAKKIQNEFLTENGVVNDLSQNTGTAEMNYLTILALRKVGENDLAEQIKQRWLDLNKNFYEENGFLLSTYNLKDPQKSNQDLTRMDGALSVLTALLNE